MSKIWLLLALLVGPAPSSAHSWYPSECCKDEHCHPAPCDSIKPDRGGFWWFDDGSKQIIFFERGQVKASQDEWCHVCITGWTGVCIFLPWRG